MIQKTTHKTPCTYKDTYIHTHIYIYLSFCLYAICSAFVLEVTSREQENSNKYQLFNSAWHYKIILLLILHELHLTNLFDPKVVGKKV